MRLPFRALAILALLLLFASGCESTRVILRRPQTNDVSILATNAVPQVALREVKTTTLNPIPGLDPIVESKFVQVTNFVSRVETNIIRIITPEVAYTNVALSPIVTGGVELAGAVAPVPWAGAATGLFGVVAGSIFSFVNARRKNEALGLANKWQDTARVLVENVESVRKAALALPAYTPALDKQVMRGIQVAQALAGVKADVAALVEAHTDNTIPA